MHNPPLVLIADDESDFRQIIAATFTKNGFWVTEAKNGNEAIERAKSLKPDLIILDLNMAQGNGTEAIIGLKNDPETKDIKVMFLTSLDRPWPLIKAQNPEFAKELGATDFLNKSEDLATLVKKVRQALGLDKAA